MKRGIGYPRVSGMAQGESGYSLPDQISQIEQYCRDQGIELVAHFPEVESAKTVSGRPSFKAALRHLYAGGADYLIVTNLDRFSRSVFDAEALRQSMEKRGKKLLSVQQNFMTPMDCNPDYEDEIISMRQRASIEAEFERKKIRRRCIRGKARKAGEGGWIGHYPWFEVDIVRGRPVINTARARVIRLILQLRQIRTGKYKDQHLSFGQIAKYLNGDNNLLNADGTRGRKFPCPSDRETIKERRTPKVLGLSPVWHSETVRRIYRTYEQRAADITKYANPRTGDVRHG